MINYDELKTALRDISNICRMTDCNKCPMQVYSKYDNGNICVLHTYTPNNWTERLKSYNIQIFADRGAHMVEEGYIDE